MGRILDNIVRDVINEEDRYWHLEGDRIVGYLLAWVYKDTVCFLLNDGDRFIERKGPRNESGDLVISFLEDNEIYEEDLEHGFKFVFLDTNIYSNTPISELKELDMYNIPGDVIRSINERLDSIPYTINSVSVYEDTIEISILAYNFSSINMILH